MNKEGVLISFTLIIGLWASVQAVSADEGFGREKIEVKTDQRKWALAFQDEKGHSGVTKLVLPDETIENWSELITIEYALFKVLPMKLEQGLLDFLLATTQKGLHQDCQNVQWNLSSKTASSATYDWSASGCKEGPGHSEVARMLVGEQGIYTLRYAHKKIPMPKRKKKEWERLLNESGLSYGEVKGLKKIPFKLNWQMPEKNSNSTKQS